MKSVEELKHWVLLWRVSGVGPKNFQKLLLAFSSPEAALNASVSSLKSAGISDSLAKSISNSNKDEDTVQLDINWLEAASDHFIITIQCDHYPKLLKQISAPPPLLYVHGNLSILNDPQLAIIGSRSPTQGGKTTAYDFSKHLAQTGLCITSGLALGIDGVAHQAAVDVNAPTIAVIATGIDRVYPARHRELAHAIVKEGAIISEFPIGVQPKPENFPRRNRIISGLSIGTLVVEAALRSGSLITARLASEQGREVFAIPGSIHNPLARGCHLLIRQGAKLVETAQDILEEISALINLESQSNHPEESSNDVSKKNDLEEGLTLDKSSPDNEQEQLLEQMGYDPVPIDDLVLRTGLPVEELSAMLLMLELQSFISSSGNGTYTRLK